MSRHPKFEGPSTKETRRDLLSSEDQARLLSDDAFAVIKPLLPEYPRPAGQKGYPPSNPRVIVDAVLWRARHGTRWSSIPIAFGKHKTVFHVFNEWSKSGLWQQVYEQLLAHHAALGLIDEELFCADGSVARAHKAAAGARTENKKSAA